MISATYNESKIEIFTNDDFIVNNIKIQNESTPIQLEKLYNKYPSPIKTIKNSNEKKYTYTTFLNKK